jgi:hypothetical protein
MNRFFLENLWRWKCGLPEYGKPINETVSFNELKKTEWSEEFEKLMRNRLIMGALRYGRINVADKPIYDRVASMIRRLHKYQESGNKEFLVDVANLSLLEFEECKHPKAHFNSIDDGEHVQIVQ